MTPGRFHNSLSFGQKCSVSNPSLFLTSLPFCVAEQWISHPCPQLCTPSLLHLCAPSSTAALAQVSPSCPQHPFCAPRSTDFQSLSHHSPKANPFCKSWCVSADRTVTNVPHPHCQCHLPVASTGVGADGLFCHSPSLLAGLLFQELIFQPASSGASLRATWWTQGAFPSFLFHRQITWEN